VHDQNLHRNSPRDLLDLKTAAVRFSLSTRTLRRLLARGMRSYRPSPNSKILLDARDVLAFLAVPQKQEPDLDALVAATLQDLQQGGGQ
jgi:hypothetical protein